jgi:hypothetical protein
MLYVTLLLYMNCTVVSRKSSTEQLVRCHPRAGILEERSGNAYGLCIGVDNTNDGDIVLSHASIDAQEITTILQHQGYCIKTLCNEVATADAIFSWIDSCGGDYRKQRKHLQKKDRILLYFSGHGKLFDDSLCQYCPSVSLRRRPFEFILKLYHNSNGKKFHDICASELINRLVATGAHQIVVFFDACNSGVQRPDRIPTSAFNDNLLFEGGLFLLSSWERFVEEQLFTSALKEGLIGWDNIKVDLNRDNLVDAHELAQYVNKEVQKVLYLNGEHYRAPTIFLGQGTMVLTVKPSDEL